jgi:hypothetical protein
MNPNYAAIIKPNLKKLLSAGFLAPVEQMN